MSCSKSHRLCRTDVVPQLPTRVLDVCHQPDPRLFCSEGLAAPYIALSHSWGSSQPLRTLKHNVVSHTEGIAIESVPRTFQDAIRVTRHLGIRYLWIDSLCIVQDDREDWAREAARMGDYYSKAELVIATSSSTGCMQGFLGSRPESIAGTLQIPRDRYLAEKLQLHFREALLGDSGSIARQLGYQLDTLSTRGWCFQERLLARRYLSFGRHELLWECNAACWCESSDLSNPDLGMDGVDNTGSGGGGDHDYNLSLRLKGWGSSSSSFRDELYQFWRLKVVRHYAHRALTRYEDRLVAVQGIADVLAEHLGDISDYAYGVWKGDALWGLSWSTEADYQVTGPCVPLDVAPTWSWASIYGRVSYSNWPERIWSVELEGFEPSDDATMSPAAPQLSPNNRPSLSLQLRGQLLSAQLEIKENDDIRLFLRDGTGKINPELSTTQVFLDTPCQTLFLKTPDGCIVKTVNRVDSSSRRKCEQEQRPGLVSDAVAAPATVWILHLYSSGDHLQTEFLILGQSNLHEGKFQRIGMSRIGRTKATFNEVQRILDEIPKAMVSII